MTEQEKQAMVVLSLSASLQGAVNCLEAATETLDELSTMEVTDECRAMYDKEISPLMKRIDELWRN